MRRRFWRWLCDLDDLTRMGVIIGLTLLWALPLDVALQYAVRTWLP